MNRSPCSFGNKFLTYFPLADTQQVLNTMPRSGVNRAKWAGNDEREELYKQFVGDQEEKNKELLNENDHLRLW